MGYNTDFRLTCIKRPLSFYQDEVEEDWEDFFSVIIHEDGRINGKWYDYEESMKAASERFPEEVFVLRGEGEEFPDIWRSAYHKGKVYNGSVELVYSSIVTPGATIKEARKDTGRR